MRGVIASAALVAVTVAACSGPQSLPLVASSPPSDASSPTSVPDAPQSTGSVGQAPPARAQAPTPPLPCTHEQAAEIVRVQHTLQASNDACVVYWRSMEVRLHPERSFYLECNGLKAYPDPQPAGHPVSLAECDRRLRERQARMGVSVTGMSEEERATYRATWGGS